MPRRPAVDEREIIPERTGAPEARVYLVELARFLDEPPAVLRKYAKQRGFLHTVRSSQRRVAYVSEHGAMRLIAYVRARQGERHLEGKNILELRAADARRKQRKRKEVGRGK